MVELDLIETLNSGLPIMFRLQKERFFPLPTEQIKRLRAKNLVGGRGAKIFISAQVAVATGQEVSYVNNKGLDAKHYKALVLDLLALGVQPRQKINSLLLSKLPTSISGNARQKEYIKNLLQEMARDRQIENVGGPTRAARWQLKK